MKNFIMNELKKYEFKCNADVRKAIAQTLKANFGAYPSPHDLCLKDWAPVIKAAIKVGGAVHGTKYAYRNAQGTTSVAKVYDLYDIPFGLVNPVLICFSGYMPAAIYTLEAFRAYYEKYNEYLPIAATGKGGNKGLFEEVFNRDKGLMIHSEAEAYMRILEEVLAYDWVRQFQREISDTDTKGNFAELYHLAKSKEWKEVTFILCSGQPWYTKRLLAEGMLEFGKPEYADVKVNLVVLDCPLTLDSATPEGHLSEIMLGYIAASLGPLTKDTTPLGSEPDFNKERYLLPEVAQADWSIFEELITLYSNMGWPDYQELLYGIDHETAVYNIIMSDLRARASFTPQMYDEAIDEDITIYMGRIFPHQKKFFCRKVYLRFNGGEKKYLKTSYLNFKTNFIDFALWRKCFGKENFF